MNNILNLDHGDDCITLWILKYIGLYILNVQSVWYVNYISKRFSKIQEKFACMNLCWFVKYIFRKMTAEWRGTRGGKYDQTGINWIYKMAWCCQFGAVQGEETAALSSQRPTHRQKHGKPQYGRTIRWKKVQRRHSLSQENSLSDIGMWWKFSFGSSRENSHDGHRRMEGSRRTFPGGS